MSALQTVGARSAVVATVIATFSAAAAAWAQPQPKNGPTGPSPKAQAVIFDPAADAESQIAAALAMAKRDNQRVLVMFGANWCGWSHKLHKVFENDKQIAKRLLDEYQLVLVDIGRRDKHMDVALGYGVDLEESGIPYLTVLDADGHVLANQETGSLEDGDHHDPAKVAAFLDKWQAEPWDAEKLLADALALASAEQRSVFLYLVAPRCTWSRTLDEFLARKQIAEILRQDFILRKIDIDRMTNAKGVSKRYGRSGKSGIPWFAFLDACGEVLVTSDGPRGNVGFPVEPHEIDHFVAMLRESARRISGEQIGRIEKALRDQATALKAAQPASRPTASGPSGG